MTKQQLVSVFASTLLLSSCGVGNALWQAEQSCVKFPTPDSRAECERKVKADQAAYAIETQKAKDQERARVEADRQTAQPAPDDARRPSKPQNNLCFKRTGSDELVCPN